MQLKFMDTLALSQTELQKPAWNVAWAELFEG